jgi:RNA polymerase sigma-70 factor (ECF subfamily)
VHLPKVLRDVRHLGVPERDAEDVAQDVMIAVGEALPRYDVTRPIRPWLRAVVYRTARDFKARAMQRERPTGDLDARLDDVADDGQDPEHAAYAREAAELFADLLGALDDDQREVYLMREIDGLTVPEIAEVLDVPIGTVASRLSRGRERFEASLARRRAAEAHKRTRAAAFLPMLLADPGQILDAARQVPTVTAETAARIWSGISAATIATGAAVGGASGVAGVASAASVVAGYTARQFLAGVVSTLLVGAASGGGTVYAMLDRAPVREAAPIVALAEGASATAAGDRAPVDVAPLALPVAVVIPTAAPSATVAPVLVAAPAASTDRAELVLLGRARADIAAGRDAAALTVLQRHRTLYPHGVYSFDRDALIQRATARIDGHDGDPQQ